MLLRASGEHLDLNSVTSDDADPGVPWGQHLRALTEATIRGQWMDLPLIIKNAASDMGEQQVVDALVVAAAFNGITRVADATGIPLDENTALATAEMREKTGIARFAYSEKTQRYG